MQFPQLSNESIYNIRVFKKYTTTENINILKNKFRCKQFDYKILYLTNSEIYTHIKNDNVSPQIEASSVKHSIFHIKIRL